MEEEKCPMVIAMKGLPCCGKSTLARRLSRNLGWPLIDQDDILSSILNKLHHPNLTPSDTLHLQHLSFQSATDITLSFLSTRLNVILDSPLPDRSHVDRLFGLCSSAGAALIIVDCVAKDKFEWQFWVDKREDELDPDYYYKPSSWGDITDYIEEYEQSLTYDLGDVSSLVVDTTSDFQDYDLFFAVDELLEKIRSASDIHHMDFSEWLFNLMNRPREDEDEDGRGKPETQSHAHYFALYKRVKKDSPVCQKCSGSIPEPPFYMCRCELALHESCAESPHDVVLQPLERAPYLSLDNREYNFPELHRCRYCTEENKEFSHECPGCVFESHIKCGLLPSVLRHGGHKHVLYFMIHPMADGVTFKCHTCGDKGADTMYRCRDCNFRCHVSCAFGPTTVKNKHHRHVLTRTYDYSHDESAMEYYCKGCETKINPNYWMYNCDQCDFPCHLNCRSFA